LTSSSPPEFTVRPPRAEEAEAVHAVFAAWAAGFDEDFGFGVDDLRVEWSYLDLEQNAWVWERAGRLAAYASLRARGRQHDADAFVHPDFSGQGLESAVVETTEARARSAGGVRLGRGALASDRDLIALLGSRGYRDVRHYYRMTIDMDGPPPAPTWSEGLEPRPFELEHARAFYAADEEAFEDERGHEPISFEEFERHWLSGLRFDPSLWTAVWDGDEIAATLIAQWKRFGGGWISGLSVRQPWRRRGVGLALLLQSFGQFYERGERLVALSVDSESPTGATRLYERAGMRVAREEILFQKDLRAG
jgi:mycothiol synthase